MAEKLSSCTEIKDKITVIQNFIGISKMKNATKGNYILYFGRYSKEKGVENLLEAVDLLPEIEFVFAGSGPLEPEINKRENIVNRGFVTGEDLAVLVSGAEFSVVPSVCYENCPFSVIESIVYGTAVLGADIGGIPELIKNGKTGELFESGNVAMLTQKIKSMHNDKNKLGFYTVNCNSTSYPAVEEYCEKLLKLYC